MKKLFLVVAVGVVLVSCKKSSGLGSNSIQATFDGTGSTYSVLGSGTLSNGGKNVEITATNGTAALKAYNIDIVLSSNSAIVPGTYTDTSERHVHLPSYSILNRAGISYSPVADTVTTSNTPLSYRSANDSTGLFTVTVTSVSTTSIQGTFQGDVYLNQLPFDVTAKKEFTNGKFNVNLTIQ